VTFGAKETAHLSRPPPEGQEVAWVVWPRGSDIRLAIVVRARLGFDARAEGCRRLGCGDVECRRATEEEAARAR